MSRTYTYGYDENGNKETRLFPNGDTTTYNYDALDRLESEVYSNGGDENRTYKYNNNGAVVNCTDNTGIVKYEYDILGRQVTETKLNSNEVEVSVVESFYDKANNRIRCFFPDQKKTLVSLYDKRNLLIIMKGYQGTVNAGDDEDNYPGQAELTTYIYNANGTQVSCTLPNGQTTTKELDQADRITKTTTSVQVLAETVNSYTAVYKKDAAANQLQAIETRSIANGVGSRTRTLNFIYDDIYRLTVESDDLSGETVVNTYIYDLQGNRISRIQKTESENDQDSWLYTNDILNRTTAVQIDLKGIGNTSVYTYQYDENGNRELRAFIDEDNETSTHTYSYDQENRLINVNDGSDDIFKASYDYRTRRTAKTEVNSKDEFETTAYIYDGGTSCQEVKVNTSGDEYDGTNGFLDKQYIRGNGMGGGIGSVCYMERPADFASTSADVQNFYDAAGYGPTDLNGSSNMLAEYYAYNAVGSVVANTDQQGLVIRENDFDAYGRVVRTEGHTPDNFPIELGGSRNDLLFSTKERDFSIDLDCHGFRYYDSLLGKYIQKDPLGSVDGPNDYLYVNNNPINAIDPLGLSESLFWHHEIPTGGLIGHLARKAGIDVHAESNGVNLNEKQHKQFHENPKGKTKSNWDTDWKVWSENFIDRTGRTPKSDEIFAQNKEMLKSDRYKDIGGIKEGIGKAKSISKRDNAAKNMKKTYAKIVRELKAAYKKKLTGRTIIALHKTKIAMKKAATSGKPISGVKSTNGKRKGGRLNSHGVEILLDIALQGRDYAQGVNNMFPYIGIDSNGYSFSIGKAKTPVPFFGFIEIINYHYMQYWDGPLQGEHIEIGPHIYDQMQDVFEKQYRNSFSSDEDRKAYEDAISESYYYESNGYQVD